MKNNNNTESEIFAQIKQSLGSYQEEYIPGSWENFLQKRKNKRRILFMRITSGIAACLLIGFVGFEFIHFEKRDNLNITPAQMLTNKINAPVIEKSTTKESAPLISSLKSEKQQSKSDRTTFLAKSAAKKSISTPVKSISTPAESKTSGQGQEMLVSLAKDTTKKMAAFAATANNEPGKSKSDSIKKGSDSIRVNAIQRFISTPAPDAKQNLAETSKRKVRFGINFSPGVSTAQSSSSFNYTGGVSADIKLFANFQLSTGLQIDNQSIVKKLQGIVASSTTPQNQSKTKLINLDVPVNITWKFFSEKTKSYYVSAGLSSLVYLRQENKHTTYSQELTPMSSFVGGQEIKSYNVVNQVSVTQNTVTPQQTFDFAGRVNIMVGFEKKLTDKLFIHIEPFAKIPASGLAPGNLNQTSTGVNFKISF